MQTRRASTGLTIRDATRDDLPRLTEVYNHYILHTPATFDMEPYTVEQRVDWFSHYGTTGPHRLLVAEADGTVIAGAWSSPYRPRRAYDRTIETSVYCDPDHTGRGAGTALYSALFAALAEVPDLHRAVAGITLPNAASVRLHEQFGFTHWGTLTEAGYKFDRYWDVGFWSKPLS